MFLGVNVAGFVWLAAMLILLIIEAAAPGLVSVWFAVGALAAMIAAFFHAPLWLQIVWFLLVSVISLVLTRPLVKKYVNGKIHPTNVDALLNKNCIVEEEINNLEGTGAVKIDGKIWTARSLHDDVNYTKGQVVKAIRIEGVKIIVE